MKNVLLLGAAALTFLGCDGGSSKCDTGDTACESGGNGDVLLENVNGFCSGSTCTWEVTTTGSMGTVELDLVETGDPSWTCGPSSTKGELVCGAWSEFHNDFTLVDFDDNTETKEINLNLVGSFEDQVQNQSTIFDVSDSAISNQLTVLFTVTDENGNYADCAAYGHDPSYFSDVCSNFW
ncbi:MAG: hypothetical protein Q8P18_25285 [Pseudomonadota bacterium]|nr:hypothetical protein [Pseudomonadota bacterium]